MTHTEDPAQAGIPEDDGRPPGSLWRTAGWSAAALLLLLPLVAMHVTDHVTWTVSDFVLAAALVLGAGAVLELAVRKTRHVAYRQAVALALAAAFLLVWVNGAVGVIGSEDNDVNALYGGVLAVGVVGALVARFRPRGMVWAMAATALAQASVAAGALVAGLSTPASGPIEIVAINTVFVALWAGAAALFQKAAQDRSRADTELER